MTKFSFIVLVMLSLPTMAQFPEEHLNLLSRINCELSDPWNVELDRNDSFNGILDIPAIMVDLMTYKTEDERHGNIGVGVYLFAKGHANAVLEYMKKEQVVNSKYEQLETDSYIVIVEFFASGGEVYDTMVARLVPELQQYFQVNKGNL